jgi:hypothetical protein
MEDRTVPLLQEIRDLLQRTVTNQEQVLRANAEAMQMYKASGRRQTIGIVAVLLLFAAVSALILR